ncbi:aldolase/citrate lyase family protein [Paracoccus sp. (in: a-proteobacteria)]|uniref:aldolase/citrate lyase family protein n=1 Tax=Paracoccus sp. TaxID=267 RepID=UPI0035B49E08
MTSLRQRIAARQPLRGPFIAIPSPMSVEIVAGARPDFICIDTEHSPIGDALLADMIRAADVAGVPALVRVRGKGAEHIAAALDAGAAGVVVPHVSTEAEARAAVHAARFAPEGGRGAGPGRAAAYLRDIPGAIARARRDTVVALQLETLEAVANVEAILAVPGIDLAFIGPGDLAVDRDARGEAAPLSDLIDRMVAAASAAGVPAGIFTATRDASRDWLGRLAFVIEGSDALYLTRASDDALAPLPA